MIRQTSIAQTLDFTADRARYDQCAKKLLSYTAVVAWILKSCTNEFSQYSVRYIMENCIVDQPQISTKAVHQDEFDSISMMDGNKRLEALNSEANAISEQTVYYDIRLKAMIPEKIGSFQLIINLEIQTKDNPGYPLVKRGFFYCSRMISEQYGTVFTKEDYGKLQKVYSIWICPDPAKKRRNSIFRYHTMEETVYGTPYAVPEQYDLTEVVIINLGDAEKSSEVEILDLLNVLFSSTISSDEKKKRLSKDYNIAMTEEFESEVTELGNLSDAIFELGEQRGKEIGQNSILMLMQKLFSAGRYDDAQRATEDDEFCAVLLNEFKLI